MLVQTVIPEVARIEHQDLIYEFMYVHADCVGLLNGFRSSETIKSSRKALNKIRLAKLAIEEIKGVNLK